MTTATENFVLVNNTGADIRDFDAAIIAHVNDRVDLPEAIADLFEVEILEGYNADGSNRGIVNWA